MTPGIPVPTVPVEMKHLAIILLSPLRLALGLFCYLICLVCIIAEVAWEPTEYTFAEIREGITYPWNDIIAFTLWRQTSL